MSSSSSSSLCPSESDAAGVRGPWTSCPADGAVGAEEEEEEEEVVWWRAESAAGDSARSLRCWCTGEASGASSVRAILKLLWFGVKWVG